MRYSQPGPSIRGFHGESHVQSDDLPTFCAGIDLSFRAELVNAESAGGRDWLIFVLVAPSRRNAAGSLGNS